MEAVFSAVFQKDGRGDGENVVHARKQLDDAHETPMCAGKDYDDAWNAVLAPTVFDTMTEAWNGIPSNPEQDGYHWLSHHGSKPEPHRWCRSALQKDGTTKPGTWLCLLFKTRTTQWASENGYAYVSPCVAPCGANEAVGQAHMEKFLSTLYSR